MINKSNKIIVKVGKKSLAKFSNSKVYRAITVKDLELISEKEDNCHIVILENIDESEQESIKSFVKSFKEKNDKNDVLFFIPDNDDITSGIADELEYNIYMTLGDLYKVIYDNHNINVSTFIDDKKRLNSTDITESMPDGMTDIFGDLSTVESDDIKSAIEEVEQSDLEQAKKESTTEEDIKSEKEEYTGTLEKDISNIEELSEDDKKELSDNTSDYIERLKMDLRDAKYDYNTILKDMVSANEKITSLENLIRVIKDEKEAVIEKYNSIVSNEEVLEDPISLAEYSEIKDNLSNLENKVAELKATIEKLNNTIEEKNNEIKAKEDTVEELRNNIENINSELKSLNETIESGDIHKDIVEEYNVKIDSLTKEKEKIQSRLESIESDNDSLKYKLEDETNRAESESLVKLRLQEDLQKVLVKIKDMQSEIEPFKKNNSELQSQINNYKEKISEYEKNKEINLEKIRNLESQVNSADKKIEIANTSFEADKLKLNEQISDLSTKLNITKQQLEQKESQYNQLVATSGIDENGASALIETNKTLENISKTLREQLSTCNKELERARSNESEVSKQLETYKAQCKNLQNSLQSIASAGGTGAGAISADSLRPIRYNMQSKIITVFGSGSFGITTTAMSLAQKLSATSRVLYVDFDLVSPMADSWFRINPMLNNIPGTFNGSTHNSGLGIFYEHGQQMFEQYIGNIAISVNTTKGGGLYYLSGLYYNPGSIKLVTSDYDSFFNLLGKHFQYIVIDFGRLGSNEIGDQLIKTVSDIAYKNIVVTTSNFFEIRNFKIKLNNLSFNLDKISWLINMCTSTALDEKVKNQISPCKYDMLPRMESYGKQENFLRGQATRERFGLFVDRTVFNR